jgi:hypothetical protein
MLLSRETKMNILERLRVSRLLPENAICNIHAGEICANLFVYPSQGFDVSNDSLLKKTGLDMAILVKEVQLSGVKSFCR